MEWVRQISLQTDGPSNRIF